MLGRGSVLILEVPNRGGRKFLTTAPKSKGTKWPMVCSNQEGIPASLCHGPAKAMLSEALKPSDMLTAETNVGVEKCQNPLYFTKLNS